MAPRLEPLVDPVRAPARYSPRLRHAGRAAGPGRGSPPRGHTPLSMIARTALLPLAIACVLASVAPRPLAAAARDRDGEASRLLQHAERLLAFHTIEQRRAAIAELEHACDLAPGRADVQ